MLRWILFLSAIIVWVAIYYIYIENITSDISYIILAIDGTSGIDYFILASWAIIAFLFLMMSKEIKDWANVPRRVGSFSLVFFAAGAILILYLYTENEINVINYIILAILAIIAAPFAIWRMTITHDQKETDKKRHYADSYIRAVANLANQDTIVRMGGIYSLGVIMAQDEDHRSNIVELLCGFIRETSSINRDTEKTKEDIQAALDVLKQHPKIMIEEHEK